MTESESRADYAWERMYDWSLPVLIALDMVQDVGTGERADAVKELLAAALRWYEPRQPKKRYRQRKLPEGAALMLSMLRHREWHEAGVMRRDAALFVTHKMSDPIGRQDWSDWLHEDKRLIYLCRELDAVAPTTITTNH